MQRRLHVARTSTYREGARPWSKAAGLWEHVNVWEATCALAERDAMSDASTRPAALVADLADRLRGLDAYTSTVFPGGYCSKLTSPGRVEGGRYYDDNAWVALALLHHHAISPIDTCIDRTRRVLDFCRSGWWDEPGLAKAGGVRWAQPSWSTTRNTCSTAPTIDACARLVVLARRDEVPVGEWADEMLEWAVRAYAWVRSTLQLPDGLYADRIEQDGTVRSRWWAYNQGSMVGAATSLHEATGQRHFLDNAVADAGAGLRVLADPERRAGQGPPFMAIFLRNLVRLPGLASESGELEPFRDYGEESWTAPSHRRNGLFERNGEMVRPTAGMVALYAMLAGGAGAA